MNALKPSGDLVMGAHSSDRMLGQEGVGVWLTRAQVNDGRARTPTYPAADSSLAEPPRRDV